MLGYWRWNWMFWRFGNEEMVFEEVFLNLIFQGGILWCFDDGFESCLVEDVVFVKFIFVEGVEVWDDDCGVDGEGLCCYGEMVFVIFLYCIVFFFL